VLLGTVECLQRHCRLRQVWGSVVAFFCFALLVWIPCQPMAGQPVQVKTDHIEPPPDKGVRLHDVAASMIAANYWELERQRKSNARP
jgi:hypothetical protein